MFTKCTYLAVFSPMTIDYNNIKLKKSYITYIYLRIDYLKVALTEGQGPGQRPPLTPTFSLQWEMGKQTHLDGGTLHLGQPT